MDLPDPARLRIVLYPDPVLKRKCAPVEEFGPHLKAVTDRMLELMRKFRGVGLAAPQVGLPYRFFVCNPTGEPGDDFVCVNPRFTELSGSAEAEEGCLSLPGVNVNRRRPARAVMEALDTAGQPFTRTSEDLPARIWQHEAGHLDGRLIVDNMSTTDEIANRRALKQLKEQYDARHPGRSGSARR